MFDSRIDRCRRQREVLQREVLMKLIIDLGGRKFEELHPSEANARSHLSIVLDSHKSRGHIVAKRRRQRQQTGAYGPRFVVQTPQGWLQYWLER